MVDKMSKKSKLHQVDDFTYNLFQGNLADCVIDEWLSDELMQKIG